jgi:alpha-beta hydrolase superfamily lysophospholipase
MATSTQSCSLIGILFSICLLLASHPAQSEIVVQKQPSGFTATAELLEGSADKKAVLILHGFLQTRDFFTVHRLAEALHESGYTILLPNLTLGIDNRRQSLACEAIHTHSMEQDVAEIDFWVSWLQRRTGQSVILIGHSAGSVELVAYLAEQREPPVDQAILISLIAFAQGPIAKENEAERQRALQQLADGQEGVSHYPLAYCDSYTTTPENYLSYLAWNGNKTLENLNNLAVTPTIILGGEDRRLEDDWPPSLKRSGAEVIEIPGANHFFDHEYEFDLMDRALELLER